MRWLVIVALLLAAVSADAQTNMQDALHGIVVPSCGSQSYTVGTIMPITQDATGANCIQPGSVVPSYYLINAGGDRYLINATDGYLRQ